jgi:hypothetical protein
MSNSRDNLIKDLVADLRPVANAGRLGRSVAAWLAIATGYSTIVVLATGPLRPGAIGNLAAEPTFALETTLAVLAIIGVAWTALASAIPGRGRPPGLVALAGTLLAAWIAVYVIGLVHPAHPVSTLGARPNCIWQAVLFSLPPLCLMLWTARRFLPLWPRATGLLAGAAAAAIPAELMQFGCMYVPAHILTHHIGPIFITAAIGTLLAPLALSGRPSVPRGPDRPLH